MCMECVRPKAPWRLTMGIPQQQQQQQQVNDSKDYSRLPLLGFFFFQLCFWAWKPHKSYCFSTSLSFKRAKLHTATPTAAHLHTPPPLPHYTPYASSTTATTTTTMEKSVFVYGFILHARFKCLPLPRPSPPRAPVSAPRLS